MRRVRVAAALSVVAFAGSGCSVFAVQRPPPGRFDAPVNIECTESVAAPVVDTAFAVTYVALAALALAKGGAGCCSGPGCFGGCPSGILAAGLGGGALFGASAAYGYATTSRCRDILRHAQ